MATVAKGMVKWSGGRDNEGHREYNATWLVQADNPSVGPAGIFAASGLPAIGAAWPEDAWAFCLPESEATPLVDKEQNIWWHVVQKFSTKPLKRCQTASIEDPLDEPPKLSGSFLRYTKEATVDRNGRPIQSSSHEVMRGKLVEKDGNRPQVIIEMNFGSNQLSTFAPMIDTVNDSTLWGLPARCVKLSNAPWRRVLYGICTYYYTVAFEFDIDYNTWDRRLIDHGTRVLACGGNPNNPLDFVAYQDNNGNTGHVILDGSGNAWNGTGSPGYIDAEFYSESNLLLLGIPSSL